LAVHRLNIYKITFITTIAAAAVNKTLHLTPVRKKEVKAQKVTSPTQLAMELGSKPDSLKRDLPYSLCLQGQRQSEHIG
jgi:hypothetical protein